ncbi:MAG: hypothetical protein JKY51_05680 [Opitutaceae bacterium]|nr:hypothetical protein [Opitutaceae bacterium]
MTHPVIEIIEQMYHAREQIAHAYDEREIQASPDEADRILPLVKSYLMNRKGDNNFRLTRRLNALFDLPLRKQRISSIDTNLGDDVRALEDAMRYLNDDSLIGHDRYETRIERLGDVEDILYSIHDLLDDNATRIQARLDNNFGLLATSKAKKAENQRYLNDLDKLIDSYNQTIRRLREEPFTDDLDVLDYIENFSGKTIAIVEKIKRCQNTIREFLYKQREIELKARRIRSVFSHLRRKPGFLSDVSQAEEASEQQNIFYQIKPITISAAPNIDDPVTREEMVDLIQDIQLRSKTAPEEKTSKGKSLIEGEGLVEEVEDTPEAIKALVVLMGYTHELGRSVSLKEYWSDHQSILAVTLDEFAFESINYLQSEPVIDDVPVSEYIDYEITLIDHPIYSGNKWLNDLILMPVNRE